MRVKFLVSVTTKACEEDRVSYKAGQVIDLPEPSARHWLNRGKAVAAKDEPAEKPAPASPPPAAEKPAHAHAKK